MSIHVDSEIGRLRRVLIHRPGDEIVRMTQHDLSRMLFDDILCIASNTELIYKFNLEMVWVADLTKYGSFYLF